MKKVLLISSLLVFMLSANIVWADCWTADVLRTSPVTARFNSTGVFANRDFALSKNTAALNQQMAILLTALSSGKQVIVCANANVHLSPITNVFLLR